MTSVILACLWVVLAQVIAFIPSRDKHWRAAYFLMAIGIPILVYIYLENGLVYAVVAFVAAASILRWPVYYGFLKLRKAFGLSRAVDND